MPRPIYRPRGFQAALLKGLQKFFPAFGGDGSGTQGLFGMLPFLPGAGFDYRTEAGALWENSIVLAGINFIATTLPEATLGVGDIGDRTSDPRHPAAKLIANPNKESGGCDLWPGTVMSLILDGNAYWRKVRSRSGKIAELWYVPHGRIEPVWPSSGTEFISGYRIRIDGQDLLLGTDEIVHLRHHLPDPTNERKGLSPIKAALREICIDNESATFTAALLRNSGVPGALLSPDGTGIEGRQLVFEQKQREDLVALWRSKFTGDHRGEPFVSPIPMKVQPFTFNPQQMLVDKISDRPEERLCALMNLPPAVLNLGTGLRNANTRASYTEARKAAYESNIIPTQQRIARQLTAQLLPDFESADHTLEFKWDRSMVEILQEGEESRFDRATQAFTAGIIDRAEARSLIGL